MITTCLLTFALNYFTFWYGLLCSFLQLTTAIIGRGIFFDESADYITLLLSALLVTLYVVLAHLIITKIGFIFVRGEILSHGNDVLLDNLDEGVVIFQENKKDVVFLNASA